MKFKSLILLLIFMSAAMATGFAQNPASVIDSLDLEIWPDYDKSSVLVLLTGTLPEDTRLPASITLPLPEVAQLNAVARIDSKDGNMTTSQLSATSLPPPNTSIKTPALPATPGTGSGINWALAAFVSGGLIIVVALIW